MSGRSSQFLVVVAAATLVAAAASSSDAADRPTRELSLPEFMGHVMQRNAEQLWAWSAEETDAQGVHSSAPETDEQWEEAESDALSLQQLTYVLQSSSIRPDDARWDRLATDLRAAATASADAAERKDYRAFAAAGEAINARCVACHWTFAPQLEAPPPPVPIS